MSSLSNDPDPTAYFPAESHQGTAKKSFRGPWRSVGRQGHGADEQVNHPLVKNTHAQYRVLETGHVEVKCLDGTKDIMYRGKNLSECTMPIGEPFVLGPVPMISDTKGIHAIKVPVQDIEPTMIDLASPMRQSVPILELCDVTMRYRKSKTPTLKNIDVGIAPGQFISVVGPSGAGKSSICRAFVGSVKDTRGTTKVNGHPLRGQLPQGFLSFVPQQDELPSGLTVAQLLESSAHIRLSHDMNDAERSAAIATVAQQLQITAELNKTCGQLSGGQRKRVSIALELLSQPAVLVLDEPTSGLDEGLDQQLMGVLRQIADRGTAVVVVTHSVSHLSQSHTVVAVATGGHVAYYGPPTQLYPAFGVTTAAATMDRLRQGTRSNWTYQARQEASSESIPPPASTRREKVAFGSLLRREIRRLGPTSGSSFGSRCAQWKNVFLALVVFPTAIVGLSWLRRPEGLNSSQEPFYVGLTSLLTIYVLFTVFLYTSFPFSAIVRDYGWLRREYRWGVTSRQQFFAKALPWWTLSLLGGACTAGGYLLVSGPPQDLEHLPGALVLLATTMLITFASCTVGLLISALFTKVENTILALSLSLFAQVMFSGLAWPVADHARTVNQIFDVLSWTLPTRWSVAPLAAASDLNNLPMAPHSDPWWTSNLQNFIYPAAALVGLAVVCSIAAILCIRHHTTQKD